MSIATPSRVEDRLRSLSAEAVEAKTGPWENSPVLARLRELGTELWLDTGDLEQARALWKREMSAVTTNNTLANQVVQTGILDDVVKETVRELIQADPGISEEAMIMELGFVVNCHIALRLTRALGCMVSVELHPAIAEDTDRTVYFAERYYAVCPQRFYIKIPLTPEGYCAVPRVRARGIPVNFTLGFSARQNYLAAVLSNPTFCNVFLGRLNAVVSDNRLGDGKLVGEKAALASHKAVKELRDEGKTQTRQIAASMRSAPQVGDLAGMDVFTMPAKVAKEFLASPPSPSDIRSRVDKEYPVSFSQGVDPGRFEVLWSVDEKVRKLAVHLKSRGPERLTGDDLREADADLDAGLFHRYTSTDVVDIRKQGKIPEWSRWVDEPGVALDDLMTQSALQSFATDQAALDDHLRTLARSR